MKKQKTQNTNKGITLIALIITIIVMLILVSVTISMAVNGGLFDYAQKAVGETKNAIDKEQELGSGKIKIGDTLYNSVDEYIKGEEKLKPTREDFFVIDEETGIVSVKEDTSENHDGVGYYYDSANQCYVLSEENVVIPEKVNGREVKGLADYMFENATNLKSVVIPKTVETIGDYAFFACEGLESVVIPETVETIGNWAFSVCVGLESVVIPNGVKKLGYGVFESCTNLTNIVIPDSVIYVNAYAFDNTKWYNDQNDGCIYIGRTLYDYKGTMPEGTRVVIKNGTTQIGKTAFEGCKGLIGVTIPDSVIEIGVDTFRSCEGLTEITIPDSVMIIDDMAFMGCKALAQVTMSSNLSSLGRSAFKDCYSLTNIVIPNGVETIEEQAFQSSGLTEITIPVSVTTIKYQAFAFGYSLEKIIYEGTKEQWNNISLSSYWAEVKSGIIVQCLDGTINV